MIRWRCPACREPIRHNPVETHPRPDVLYRCPTCKLELVWDPYKQILTVPRFDGDEHR
jgi:hypothetical protein